MIRITPDWGRIGPIWWLNSNLAGVRQPSGWQWIYWGQVRLGGQFNHALQWIKPMGWESSIPSQERRHGRESTDRSVDQHRQDAKGA